MEVQGFNACIIDQLAIYTYSLVHSTVTCFSYLINAPSFFSYMTICLILIGFVFISLILFLVQALVLQLEECVPRDVPVQWL